MAELRTEIQTVKMETNRVKDRLDPKAGLDTKLEEESGKNEEETEQTKGNKRRKNRELKQVAQNGNKQMREQTKGSKKREPKIRFFVRIESAEKSKSQNQPTDETVHKTEPS